MCIVINIIIAGMLLVGFIPFDVSAQEIREIRTIGTFDQVEAAASIEVTLSCGETGTATVQGPTEDVADTEARVDGHVLHIERKSLLRNHRRTVRIAVTAPVPLDKLSVESGANLDVPACAISPDHLDLAGSSGGTIRIAAHTGRLVIDASSGATIFPLPGTRIDAREGKVSASSGANIRICSVPHLDARASSGGSVVADSSDMGNIHTSSGGTVSSKSCL
jgi:hypothetical protein